MNAALRLLAGLFAVPMDNRHIENRAYRHGPVETYQVFVDDFDRIETEACSVGIDLTFAIFWLSEAITSSLALPTVPKDWTRIFSAFLMAAIAGYGFGVYFLWRWSKTKNALKKLMARIRANQIPEFGEAGKELSFSALANLPGEQTNTSSGKPQEAI